MSAHTPASILIVEDERIVARDLKETLLDMGYNPYAIATSGDEALARAGEHSPDIVLMDIRLKGPLDGIDTAALLAEKCRAPVVFLTANADDAMVARAKRTEPSGYLLKPIKSSDLHSAIEIALYKRELDSTRQRLRALEQQLYAITDNLPMFIAYFDDKDRVQFANRVFRDCVQPTSYEIGKPAEEFLVGTPFAGTAERRRRVLAGEDSTFVVEWEQAAVRRIHEISYMADRKTAGKAVGVYGLATDVTDLHDSYSRIRELAQRLETIREEERRAAAKALHEGLAQDLFAMKLGLKHLEGQAIRRAGVTQACEELSTLLTKCMDDTRHIAQELLPASLSHLGLTKTLIDYADHFSSRHHLQIHVHESDEFPALDDSLRLTFFRAAQEALANIARHARASRVDIRLLTSNGRILLEIADDGVGIAPDDLKKPGCLGLLGIRERFNALGGGLDLQRRVTAGTFLTVHVPLEASRKDHEH